MLKRFRFTMRLILEEDIKPLLKYLRGRSGRVNRPLLEAFEELTSILFAFGNLQRHLRWASFTLAGVLIWVFLAIQPVSKIPAAITSEQALSQIQYILCEVRSLVVSAPEGVQTGHFCDRFNDPAATQFDPLLFEIPLVWLFNPGVFRHVLILGFTCWLAHKIAARYQADIFELPDTAGAEHFLLQSAFANTYNLMNIQNGSELPREEHLPVSRIGGPGYVIVHLENAALFEGPDGTPRVIGPTVKRYPVLRPFERLRGVIDLRDQEEVFDVQGRTQDGIRVTAKDVRVVYSVFRNHQEPSYERPYPFQDPHAIENLIYQQGGNVWNVDLVAQIRGALLDFFAMRRLNEFLAMVQEPEMRKSQEYETELIKETQRLSGTTEPIKTSQPVVKIDGIEYVPRPQLTDLFYTRAEESWLARGMETDWIGVGTWDFPAQLIRARHQDAWRITHENLAKDTPAVYDGLRQQHSIGETLRLIHLVPIGTFQKIAQAENMPAEDALRTLILAYHTQMREALGDYEREQHEIEELEKQESDPVRASELRDRLTRLKTEFTRVYDVVIFLSRFTGKWLSPSATKPLASAKPASLPGKKEGE